MPSAVQIQAFEESVSVVATIDVGTMWDRMLGEFLVEYERLSRSGMGTAQMDAALDAFMDNLSDKPVGELARKSTTVAYNEGRSAEILSTDIEFVVRSEVLDSKTCAACAVVDGSVVEVGTQDYFGLMPPALCEGGDNCRGFYIPVTGEGMG